MTRFSAKKPDREIAKRQAANVMKYMQGHIFQSVGTVRNYQSALTRIALYFRINGGVNLQDITPEMASRYFDIRAADVGQKSLDLERQALQAMMIYLTQVLSDGQKLVVVRSLQEQSLSSRSYTPEQIEIIASHLSDKNRLATRIAYNAGLRSHELFSLRELRSREPSPRPASGKKFMGRVGTSYTVQGKGGLVREIKLAVELAEILESRRLAEPVTVTDRGIHYQQFYAISAGQAWSRAFSNASTRALGWSAGSHGTRHSYAQERMAELQDYGCSYGESLEVVSQELGHFRAEITKIYLR
ncbi:site-specific integrase [Klebsiella variicola subsp. variicola]|uniref:site-specific integrase n=1 Tax=Klebsiella pneumoniae complex TaxID=3390273 RepID=UPI00292A7EBA|nr:MULTISPECIES: site-specific integrase [Klebsiella]MDV0623081.1 site-specific integrase [Klebsiella variicola subsp. variicola]